MGLLGGGERGCRMKLESEITAIVLLYLSLDPPSNPFSLPPSSQDFWHYLAPINEHMKPNDHRLKTLHLEANINLELRSHISL